MEHHFHGADIVRLAQIVYSIADAFPGSALPDVDQLQARRHGRSER
jgi:hypothetical protein